jgi:hypothetical protein
VRRPTLGELFGIDLRSLALFRIGLAVCVLADLGERAFDLVALYTDRGVTPPDLLLETQGRAVYLSVHYWAGAHPALQAGLFAISAACAVALLVGWRTRLACLACWYLVSSLQVRQPFVYMAGDSILRLLLFWGLFLPLGARFSVDAARGRGRPRSDQHVSGATAALLLQVCLIYWVTGLRKTGDLWWSGQAISYALQADEWATPLGVALRDLPRLLEWLTYGALAMELLGPLLAWSPVRTARFRVAVVALFWMFHALLAACMNIGLFPLFSMVAWIPFLPAQIWRWLPGPRDRPANLPDVRSPVTSVAALAILAYIVVFLGERASILPSIIPEPLRIAGTVLRINQSWSMFTPDPPVVTIRHEVRATLLDGSEISAPIATSVRWQIFVFGFLQRPLPSDRAPQLDGLADYHCKRWNSAGTSSPRAEYVAVVAHVRRLWPTGPDAASTHTIVEVRCAGR